jgi:hypothetical protein
MNIAFLKQKNFYDKRIFRNVKIEWAGIVGRNSNGQKIDARKSNGQKSQI